MPKFRKKPIVIEAVQFTDEMINNGDSPLLTHLEGCKGWQVGGVGSDVHLIIPTLEGDHRANKGDWIIKGVKGEFYPCKPDIFEATYEAVE